MRLTYILAVTVEAILHASATALPSVEDSNAAIENGAVPAVVDPTLVEGGRMLRRVANEYLDGDGLDSDDLDEERVFGDIVKKLTPAKIAEKSAKKAAEMAEKMKERTKDAVDYQRVIERAREMLNTKA
ncbi:hypothetical protein P3T76_015735 [Phytophthora citrophthora]|uniref:RxLR effector protein n=1 Tax=Phytophthora citrophthora TaxID=4793 RepID=A0AAD9FZF2_9STRA|nr:hypothetical protein P3T76_015735 [Phytophthora citrophthora]